MTRSFLFSSQTTRTFSIRLQQRTYGTNSSAGSCAAFVPATAMPSSSRNHKHNARGVGLLVASTVAFLGSSWALPVPSTKTTSLEGTKSTTRSTTSTSSSLEGMSSSTTPKDKSTAQKSSNGNNNSFTLFVWDFDWTIVNCNSDEYIPAQFLGDDATRKGFRDHYYNGSTKGDWHACVEAMVNRALVQETKSKSKSSPEEAVLEAARRMPYLIPVREALEAIEQKRTQQQAPVVGQMILSDGNTLFLRAFLEQNLPHIDFGHGVVSNEGMWQTIQGDDQNKNKNKAGVVLRVVHQSKKYGGHTCQRCEANLCKTQALQATIQEWQQQQQQNVGSSSKPLPLHCRIVYVGDGANDACPVLNVLKQGDVMLARVGRRRNFASERAGPESDKDASVNHRGDGDGKGNPFGFKGALEEAKEKNGVVPKCQVWEWSTGEELKRMVEKLLQEVP